MTDGIVSIVSKCRNVASCTKKKKNRCSAWRIRVGDAEVATKLIGNAKREICMRQTGNKKAVENYKHIYFLI